MKLNTMMLDQNSFSILTSIIALWKDGLIGFSIFMGLVLVLLPLLRLMAIWSLFNGSKWHSTLGAIRHLAMTDVFWGAFTLFLINQTDIIKFDYKIGYIVITTEVVLKYVFDLYLCVEAY